MIRLDRRVNGEFYVAETYRELIEKGFVITTYPVDAHYPIGTPEELDFFLKEKYHV
jgi:hypothetical protein